MKFGLAAAMRWIDFTSSPLPGKLGHLTIRFRKQHFPAGLVSRYQRFLDDGTESPGMAASTPCDD
jgi:hypothetical protein